MNTIFFVAEDEVFNPNKVLTRKQMLKVPADIRDAVAKQAKALLEA